MCGRRSGVGVAAIDLPGRARDLRHGAEPADDLLERAIVARAGHSQRRDADMPCGFVVFSGLVGQGDPTRVAAQVVSGIGFLGERGLLWSGGRNWGNTK